MPLTHCSAALALVGLVFLWHALAVSGADGRAPLKLKADGTFKVLLFTDLHFGNGGRDDRNTMKQMRELLNYEEPDLVVLGGDQISDYADTAPRPKPRQWVKEQWQNVVAALTERNGRTPWASIMGNHDYGTEGSPDEMMALDASYRGSLTIPSNDTGYVLPIYDENGGSVETRLYMMQSGPAGFYPRHNNWYRRISQSFRDEDPKRMIFGRKGDESYATSSPVPALAFIHIPLVQMLDIYNSGAFWGVMRDRDGICCQVTNHSLFESFVEFGEVRVVSHGHDHDNNFVGHRENIAFAYGRKTGDGGYNVKGKRGARVFLIRKAPLGSESAKQPVSGIPIVSETQWDPKEAKNMSYSIHTWIRLIDGKLDEQTTLVAEPPIHKLTHCCIGPPKEVPYGFIFAAIGTSLLVLFSVSLLIHGYCRYKRLSKAPNPPQYTPLSESL